MLDKAIIHGKEKRKPYRKAKAFDYTCRNHGICEWCRDNRLHKFIKSKALKEDSQESDGFIERDVGS